MTSSHSVEQTVPATPHAKKQSVGVTCLLLIVVAILCLALWMTLLLIVPQYERAFRNRDLELPAPTQWTVAASQWTQLYWYIVPLFGLFILPVIVLLSWLLRHRVAGPLPGWLWLGALLAVPLLLQLGVWLALLMP
jgi:type II secretory pathway component PulF